MNITRVTAVRPFQVCFSSKNIWDTRIGVAVPYIYLTMQNKDAVRSITGTGLKSMVQVNDDVLCLNFVDGGAFVQTPIVIGLQQLENNLLQFDLARSSVGSSGTLLFRRTHCGNFNFTSMP